MKTKIVFSIFFTSLFIFSCSEKDNNTGNLNDNPQNSICPFDTCGASVSTFSVSSSKAIHFSRGNLQYCAVGNTWRFAEHQYDFIGEENQYISPNNYGWIDLFGWGTSGNNTGASANHPWDTVYGNQNYYIGESASNGLFGEFYSADWGKNQISNGGNTEGLWRTLKDSEWKYLIDERPDAHNKIGSATINGVYKGIVILPDEWNMPNNITFYSGENGWNNNSYSLTEWQMMENAGAVFLPAAGSRDGIAVTGINEIGTYWSATPDGTFSSALRFTRDEIRVSFYLRSIGYSVRLVKDV